MDQLRDIVPLVANWEPTLCAETDEQLMARANSLRSRISRGESHDDLLPEAFAVVRETAQRVVGLRHFDVQIMGGAALHAGWIAEMKTGEGKSLTATLAAFLNGLDGGGVHIVTVNEYLAERDARMMGKLFGFLGLSTGLVAPGKHASIAERQAQYGCDIVYSVNTELGFDLLRDNLRTNPGDKLHRGLNFAIIDEVDSILIDEARTPLIIAADPSIATEAQLTYCRLVSELDDEAHFEVQHDHHNVALTDEGVRWLQDRLGIENIFAEEHRADLHGVYTALKARALYVRDQHYVVVDDQVKIVDDFTGRVLEGRKWQDGIQQAVEAKERVPISGTSNTLATITIQNFFKSYVKLAGMTGTARSSATELRQVYGMHVVDIPTHREMVRVDMPHRIFRTKDEKYRAVVDEVVRRHRIGQPLLIGATTVAGSEKLSSLLQSRSIEHNVLNAKENAREAMVIALAGRSGSVTVATNLAGRGVDIMLGGAPELMVREELRREGFTEDVIDAVLDGTSAQHGLPVHERVLHDELRARWSDLRADFEVACEKDATLVRQLGGLCVLGTELHESERIDRQLRGRAGRQGDPGESIFFVSLEDDMISMYAPEAAEWANTQEHPVGQVIDHRRIQKAVRRAQLAVEGKNAEARRMLLEYDEILNTQRRVVYERREQVVAGVDLRSLALDTISSVVKEMARACAPDDDEWDLGSLVDKIHEMWPSSLKIEDLRKCETSDDVVSIVRHDGIRTYELIEQRIGRDFLRDVERQMMLGLIDHHWQTYLTTIDEIRDGISLRAAGQRDPLMEWRRETFELFHQMLRTVAADFVRYVMHVRIVASEIGEVVV